MFEVFSDIYFVVYNLYYIGQNDDLEARARPIHRDGGSKLQQVTFKLQTLKLTCVQYIFLSFLYRPQIYILPPTHITLR
jgi:hypothetical protein